jgi:hypothetical protein
MNNKTSRQSKGGATLSTTSESATSASSTVQMEGGGDGVLSFLFGTGSGEYATKLILDTFNKEFIIPALYILNHALESSVKLKYGETDSAGKTILHWLVITSDKNQRSKELLVNILNSNRAIKYLNKQDKLGNTVAHYALYNDLNDVLSLLNKKGIDLSIKNKEGYSIAPEEEFEKPTNVFAKKGKKSKEDCKGMLPFDKVLDNVINGFVVKTQDTISTINFTNNETQLDDDDDDETINTIAIHEFARDFVNNTNEFIKEESDELGVRNPPKIVINKSRLDDIMQSRQQPQNVVLFGGGKKVVGTRKMITNSEMSGGEHYNKLVDSSTSSSSSSTTSSSDDTLTGGMDALTSDMDELRALRKMQNREQDPETLQIFERIKELFKKEAKKEIDELTAWAYKSLLWDQIKNDSKIHKKSRKEELKKRAGTWSILKDIKESDVKDRRKILENVDKKSDDNKSDTKADDKKSSKKTDDKKKQQSRVVVSETSDSSMKKDVYTSDDN